MHVTRLRQAVVTAADREAFKQGFTDAFGVGEPFVDPGVAEFGLHNYVFPVGDTFVEVVSPVREGTTAGRFIDRNGGDCGYMAIFQVTDIEACRAHLRDLGVRMIWSHDSAAIGSVHIHPQDIGGAIVSFDEPRPVGSWPWGGPGWAERARNESVTGLAGITLASSNAGQLAQRWAAVLNLGASMADGGALTLADGCTVRFVEDASRPAPLLTGISLRSATSQPAKTVTLARTSFSAV